MTTDLIMRVNVSMIVRTTASRSCSPMVDEVQCVHALHISGERMVPILAQIQHYFRTCCVSI